MNFKITTAGDDIGIRKTGAAVDNKAVFGNLKMARAAFSSAVDEQIDTLRQIRKAVMTTPDKALREDEPAQSQLPAAEGGGIPGFLQRQAS